MSRLGPPKMTTGIPAVAPSALLFRPHQSFLRSIAQKRCLASYTFSASNRPHVVLPAPLVPYVAILMPMMDSGRVRSSESFSPLLNLSPSPSLRLRGLPIHPRLLWLHPWRRTE